MDCEKGGKNMPQGMVHIENLVKRYGDLTALNHLDLDIRDLRITWSQRLGKNNGHQLSVVPAEIRQRSGGNFRGRDETGQL